MKLPLLSVVQMRILVRASVLPGHLIAGCRLLGADRRPAATKLTRNNIRAAIFERGA